MDIVERLILTNWVLSHKNTIVTKVISLEGTGNFNQLRPSS
jgi:hypothetical protein